MEVRLVIFLCFYVVLNVNKKSSRLHFFGAGLALFHEIEVKASCFPMQWFGPQFPFGTASAEKKGFKFWPYTTNQRQHVKIDNGFKKNIGFYFGDGLLLLSDSRFGGLAIASSSSS